MDNALAPAEPIDLAKEVKTSNVLLHAQWSLGDQQTKLVYIVASQVKISDADFKEYTFEAGELMDILGLEDRSGTAYKKLKRLTRSLIREPLEFYDGDSLIMASWFCTAVYERGGKVRLQFAPRLKKHYIGLIEAGDFTRQRLGVVLSLKSEVAIRIHGLLRESSFRCGKDGSWTIRLTLAEIRRMFLLEDKYQGKDGPKNIRVKVIAPAITAIAGNSELDVRYQPFYNGKGIGGFDITASFKKVGERPAQSQIDIDIANLKSKLKGKKRSQFLRDLDAVEQQEFMEQIGLSGEYLKDAAFKQLVDRYV